MSEDTKDAQPQKGSKLPEGPDGKVVLINVGHENVGGYDFNADGKVDSGERFDCGPGGVVRLTPKRAAMLLRQDTAGKFMLEEPGRKYLAEQKAKAEREAKKQRAPASED